MFTKRHLFFLALAFGALVYTPEASAQLGRIKDVGRAKDALDKGKDATNNPTASVSPASSEINDFDRAAKTLDYCIDNKAWEDQNSNSFESAINRAKTALDGIQKKDPVSYKIYEPKYKKFDDFWKSNQTAYQLYQVDGSVKQFDNYIAKLETCVSTKTWQDANGNSYARILDYAKPQLDNIVKKAPAAAAPYQAKYDQYKKVWDDHVAANKAAADAEAKAKSDAKDASYKAAIAAIPTFVNDKDKTKSEGITSPLHQKYVGKIVFTNDKLERAQTTEAVLKTKFTGNDFIYARVYAPDAVANYAVYNEKEENRVSYDSKTNTYSPKVGVNSYGLYRVYLIVNGKRVQADADRNQKESAGWTTWTSYIHPKGEHSDDDFSDVVQLFNELPAGDHLVKVEVWGEGETGGVSLQPIATGEFTYAKTATAMKIGRSFANVKEEMKNPTLAASALKCVQEHGAQDGWKEKFTAAKITSKDWYINRDEWNIITGRSIEVCVKATWPDGHCTYQYFDVFQQYSGGGNYQSTLRFGGVGDQTKINCD